MQNITKYTIIKYCFKHSNNSKIFYAGWFQYLSPSIFLKLQLLLKEAVWFKIPPSLLALLLLRYLTFLPQLFKGFCHKWFFFLLDHNRPTRCSRCRKIAIFRKRMMIWKNASSNFVEQARLNQDRWSALFFPLLGHSRQT